MTRPTVKEHDFVGKDAYLRHREEEPAAIMCTLTVDDPTSSTGVKRYMLGGEPILTAGGERIVDRKGRPLVRHLRRVRPVARQAPVAGLPAAGARRRGRAAARPVHGRALSGNGGRRGSRPLFDPENTRVRS